MLVPVELPRADPASLARIAESPADLAAGLILAEIREHAAACPLCPAGQIAACPEGLALAQALAAAARAAGLP